MDACTLLFFARNPERDGNHVHDRRLTSETLDLRIALFTYSRRVGIENKAMVAPSRTLTRGWGFFFASSDPWPNDQPGDVVYEVPCQDDFPARAGNACRGGGSGRPAPAERRRQGSWACEFARQRMAPKLRWSK